MEGGEPAAYAYDAAAAAGQPPADPADAGAAEDAGAGADADAAVAPLPKEVTQPVWLLAFNRFAADRRRELRAENENRSGTEAERLIGIQWRSMPADEKGVYIQRAEEERNRIVATQFGGVEPTRPPRKKSVKPEAEEGGEGGGGGAEGGAAPKPGAKKRGRPPKTAYMAGAGAVPSFPPNAAAFNAGGGGPAHATVLGSRVEGVVDGTFDLGYFLTVRVAGTNQLMRAIIFRPELCAGGQAAIAPAAAAPAALPDADGETM